MSKLFYSLLAFITHFKKYELFIVRLDYILFIISLLQASAFLVKWKVFSYDWNFHSTLQQLNIEITNLWRSSRNKATLNCLLSKLSHFQSCLRASIIVLESSLNQIRVYDSPVHSKTHEGSLNESFDLKFCSYKRQTTRDLILHAKFQLNLW